jgi:hypothetical protein
MSYEAFFATGAQVIPILWVILVFEMKLYFPSSRGYLSMEAGEEHARIPWVIAAALVLTAALMFFGELRAIATLMGDDAPSDGDRDLVGAAISAGAFWTFILPAWPWVETTVDRTPIGRAKFWLWRKLGVGTPDPYADKRWHRKRKPTDDGV